MAQVILCRANPIKCRRKMYDYAWTVGEPPPNFAARNSSNSSDVDGMGKQHIILSSLDFLQSCNSVIVLLSMQLLISSLHHPDKTNVIKEPLFRKDLHDGDTGEAEPGSATCAARLLGTHAGIRLDRWFCCWQRWLLAMLVLCFVFHDFVTRVCGRGSAIFMASEIANTLVELFLACIWALCLRCAVVWRVLRRLSFYYNFVSFAAGRAAYVIIYGPRRPRGGRSSTAAWRRPELQSTVRGRSRWRSC